jgi:cysteine-rich repeat protein
MKRTVALPLLLVIAAMLVTGVAATSYTLPAPYFGEDDLYRVTQTAIANTPGLGPGLGGNYEGLGGGTGQNGMISGTQQLAPMSKMMTGAVCSALGGSHGSHATNASGIVVGMDAIDVLSAAISGGSAACNGPTDTADSDGKGFGATYSGTNGVFFGANPQQNWKWTLALLYGGLDLSPSAPSTPDCNSPARRALVNNWSLFFQNACTNGASICNDSVHTIGGTDVLWHAFRPDDASGTSDVFAGVLGLKNWVSGGPDASAFNGFGISPFCNAINWDANVVSNGNGTTVDCTGGADEQFVGPGGVVDPSSRCNFTGFAACDINAAETCDPAPVACTLANAAAACASGQSCSAAVVPGVRSCNPGSCPAGLTCSAASNGVCGTTCNVNNPCVSGDPSLGGVPLTCSSTTTVNGVCAAAGVCGMPCGSSAPCAAGMTCTSPNAGICVGGNHRMPPPGTYGSAPDPNAMGPAGFDVLPTGLQDNDPIRRPCLGSSTGNPFGSAEEVCNLDGNLGVVLSIPSSNFLPTTANHPVQYPSNPCSGSWTAGLAPRILSCAPQGRTVHSGECPNGDSLFAGDQCHVPIDDSLQYVSTVTSQCLNDKPLYSPIAARPQPGAAGCTTPPCVSIDGRVDNLAMYDGSVNGQAHLAQETLPNGTTNPPRVDFMGGMGRIHSVATVFDRSKNAGNPPNVGCQLVDATDQIGCLVQADPCSFGFASNGSKSFSEGPNQACAGLVSVGLCATGTGGIGYQNPTGATTCPAACLAVETTAPALVSESLRINQTYPNAAAVLALGQQVTQYPLATKLYVNSLIGFNAVTNLGELALGEYESSEGDMGATLPPLGYFPLGGSQTQTGNDSAGVPFNVFNAPFCEDFDEQTVCGDQQTCPPTTMLPGNVNACTGNANATIAYSGATTPPAQGSICGDGNLDPFEECDDGPQNGTPGDFCSSSCRCAGATSFMNSGDGTGWHCQSGAAASPDAIGLALHDNHVLTGALHVYIVWYNVGQTWSADAQARVRAFFNGISNTRWWKTFQLYPNQQGVHATTLNVGGECTDNANEGANGGLAAGVDWCSVGGMQPPVANNLAPNGCGLPVDPQGIYMVLASQTTPTTFVWGGCHSYGYSGSALIPQLSMYWGQACSQCTPPNPHPNGTVGMSNSVEGFDVMIEGLSHELAETITHPLNAGCCGWNFGTSAYLSEIADACERGVAANAGIAAHGSGWYLTSSGQYANMHIDPYDFTLTDLWQTGANQCYSQLLPTSTSGNPFLPYGNAPCATNADCAGGTTYGTFVCSAGQCVRPSCSNGVADGEEPDVDCGQACAEAAGALCASGQKCRTGWDCRNAVCLSNGTCQ